MALIQEDDITYSNLSWVDPVGRLFYWKGGIYRGIYPAHAGLVRELFTSGYLGELMERGLFPESYITDHVLKGFDLVVKHKTIPHVLYPHEWSFDMFRDAALAVLEIVEIGAKYGWDIKDCGPHNILFSGAQPMFVDLGSFRKKPRGTGFEKGQDFICYYWRPLYLWSLGESFFAQRVISKGNIVPDLSWWLYQHSALRFLGLKKCAKLAKWSVKWSKRAANVLRHGQALAWLSTSLASRLPVEVLAKSPTLLRHKMTRLKPPPPSAWDDYHSKHLQEDAIASTPRFDRILEIIRTLKCSSSIELAGNQGVFTLLMMERTQIEKGICTDYSSSAINRFYHYRRKHKNKLRNESLQGAVLDFMLPEITSRESPPSERLKSDIMIALAVTHHLVLSQHYPLKEVFKTMAEYSREFVMIEFMPMGLWSGREGDAPPPTPTWYTQDWFEQVFTEVFDLISVEQLEKNRVLFLGRLKTVTKVDAYEDPAEYFETRRLALQHFAA